MNRNEPHMCESTVTSDMCSRRIKNKTDMSWKYPAKVFVCRSILHLRTIYRSIIDENLTGLQISDNKRATGFRSHCFFVCISAWAVNLLKDASILKNLALPPKNTFNQNRLIKFN